MIIKAGQKSKAIYLIVSGNINVQYHAKKKRTLVCNSRGAYFGDFALIQTPSYFDFVARTSVICLVVPVDAELFDLLRPKWEHLSQTTVWRLQDLLSLKYRLKKRLRERINQQKSPSKLWHMRSIRKDSPSPTHNSGGDRRYHEPSWFDLQPADGFDLPNLSGVNQEAPNEIDQLDFEDLQLEVPGEGLDIRFSASKQPFRRDSPRSGQIVTAQTSMIEPLIRSQWSKEILTDDRKLHNPSWSISGMIHSPDASPAQTASNTPIKQRATTVDPDESLEWHQPEHFDKGRLATIGYSEWQNSEGDDDLVGQEDTTTGETQNPDSRFIECPDGPEEALWPEALKDYELESNWAAVSHREEHSEDTALSQIIPYLEVTFYFITAKI